MSANLEIVKRTYAEGPDFFLSVLSPEVEWTEAAGFPYAGTYRGSAEVVRNVFVRLATECGLKERIAAMFADIAQRTVVELPKRFDGFPAHPICRGRGCDRHAPDFRTESPIAPRHGRN